MRPFNSDAVTINGRDKFKQQAWDPPPFFVIQFALYSTKKSVYPKKIQKELKEKSTKLEAVYDPATDRGMMKTYFEKLMVTLIANDDNADNNTEIEIKVDN